MQNGSLIRSKRQRGPAVWEFRWRELGGNGKRTHRRIVLGSVDRLWTKPLRDMQSRRCALTSTRAMPESKRISPRFPTWLNTTGSAN